MKRGIVRTSNKEFPVLLAISKSEQEQGLMGESFPPPSMAFVYSYPRYNEFWMKNTPSPLDIVFCLNGKINKICKGEPYSIDIISGGWSDLVVEFPYGTCKKYAMKEGDIINLHSAPEENVISQFSQILKK